MVEQKKMYTKPTSAMLKKIIKCGGKWIQNHFKSMKKAFNFNC